MSEGLQKTCVLIVGMMRRWLRCALEVEQDTVNMQRLQIEEQKKQHDAMHDRDAQNLQAVSKYARV